jgi:gas vesicle protein
MDKVMWKVSGLLFVTSTLVGLMGGLLAAPQSGARTRKKMHRVYENIKDQVKQDVHDLKGSVANVAKQGNTYRKNWLTGKRLSEWQQGFLEFPRIAPAKIVRWHPKDVH